MKRPSGTTLVTGCAGFIGMHVCRRLVQQGKRIVGIDDLNDYYAVQLKHDRLKAIGANSGSGFEFVHCSVEDDESMRRIVMRTRPDTIIHLAAQAGVRFSIERPMNYARSNLLGMTSILEAARTAQVSHFIYASSSSVYGANNQTPYREDDRVDRPVSFYAATKVANEAMAASYSHLYGLPATGLRFFTVYGPWGRPDMAPWLFTEAILHDKPIKIFGWGKPERDFTFVDDVADGVCRIANLDTPGFGSGEHRVLNVGNSNTVSVNEFVSTLELIIGKPAIRNEVEMQPGDVMKTFSDSSQLYKLTGARPETPLRDGLTNFVDWYRQYHKLS